MNQFHKTSKLDSTFFRNFYELFFYKVFKKNLLTKSSKTFY